MLGRLHCAIASIGIASKCIEPAVTVAVEPPTPPAPAAPAIVVEPPAAAGALAGWTCSAAPQPIATPTTQASNANDKRNTDLTILANALHENATTEGQHNPGKPGQRSRDTSSRYA